MNDAKTSSEMRKPETPAGTRVHSAALNSDPVPLELCTYKSSPDPLERGEHYAARSTRHVGLQEHGGPP